RRVGGEDRGDGMAAGWAIERLGEGIGHVNGARRLDHRDNARRGGVDIWPNDVLDALLVREAFSTGDGELGIVFVIDADDSHLIPLTANLDPAFVVVHLGRGLGAGFIDEPPRGRWAAHHTPHPDLDDFLLGSVADSISASKRQQREPNDDGSYGAPVSPHGLPFLCTDTAPHHFPPAAGGEHMRAY